MRPNQGITSRPLGWVGPSSEAEKPGLAGIRLVAEPAFPSSGPSPNSDWVRLQFETECKNRSCKTTAPKESTNYPQHRGALISKAFRKNCGKIERNCGNCGKKCRNCGKIWGNCGNCGFGNKCTSAQGDLENFRNGHLTFFFKQKGPKA